MPARSKRYRAMFVDGMVERGYQRSFAPACWRQIEGFGLYGFPESHAASFAPWPASRPGSNAITRTCSAQRS
ncbi:MAG: hypothetical protein U1E17_09510 [Geminicoccaceae bacterium]